MATLLLSVLSSFVFAATPQRISVGANAGGSRFIEKKVPVAFLPTSSEDGFYSLCLVMRIPCGEERLPDDSFIETPDYVLRIEKISVRSYLDKLIEYHPKYLWEISDGVLVFRPRTRERSPLDKHIAKFSYDDRYPGAIIDHLANISWIYVEHIQQATIGPARETDDPKRLIRPLNTKPIRIMRVNASVRQILNATVNLYGSGIWIYTYSRAPSFIPQFFRRGTIKFIAY